MDAMVPLLCIGLFLLAEIAILIRGMFPSD